MNNVRHLYMLQPFEVRMKSTDWIFSFDTNADVYIALLLEVVAMVGKEDVLPEGEGGD